MATLETVIIARGKLVTLACDVTGTPLPSVEWYKDGVVASSENRRLDNGSLQFVAADVADDGEYACVATNKGGKDNATVRLIVHCELKSVSVRVCVCTSLRHDVCVISDPPSLTTRPDDEDILVDSRLTWSCLASSLPTASISWKRNDELLVPGPRLLISSDGTQLTFLAVRPSDAGKYTCIAQNYLGNITASSRLFVIGTRSPYRSTSRLLTWLFVLLVPPVIVSGDGEVKALLGSIALLPCSATGIPTPRVEWQRQARYIPDDERHTTLANGTLEIRELRLTDAASYTCVASNSGGRDRGNVTVDVQCKSNA